VAPSAPSARAVCIGARAAWLVPCATWLTSIAPLAIPDAEHWFGGLSRAAFVALPWIAFAGLPRSESARELRRSSAASAAIALALPPLALGARLDIADGLDAGAVIALSLASVALAVVLWFAAESSARDSVHASRYALAWLVIVPGVPCLCAALERGGAPSFGGAPSWLAFAARASPLAWIVRASSDVGLAGSPASSAGGSVARVIGAAPAWTVSASVLAPLCVCIVLFALGRAATDRAPRNVEP
jgi:hypothetical protein